MNEPDVTVPPPADVDIVIAPFDADTILIPVPDLRYEVPSTSLVKEPDKPSDAVTNPLTCKVVSLAPGLFSPI